MTRKTMKEFMQAINIITENMIAMFGTNVDTPEIRIESSKIEAKYRLHNCCDLSCVKFLIDDENATVMYRIGSWQDDAPDTFIGGCIKADIENILNVLNVEDEADDIGFGIG